MSDDPEIDEMTTEEAELALRKIGRPTLYSPEYDDQVRRLALLGLRIKDMARFFGVAVSTVLNWSRDYPSFREAIHRGREAADADVANALFNRATGMTIRRTKVSINAQGEITEHKYDEDLAPDVSAAQFWLTARQGQRWRAVQSVQNLDADGNPIAPPSVVVVGRAPDAPPPADES